MIKQPYTKPALTIAQQIDQLRERGMAFNDTARAAHYLSQINYYRLTAYWLPFESDHTTHTFQQGTSFEQVLDLYIFDRELRLLVMDAIERIEVAIRAQFSFQLGHRYGTHPHLNSALFKPAWDHAGQVSQLSEEARRSKETFIQHLLAKYIEQLPPIWAVVEIMTLGQLSKWYANLSNGADRNLVAHVYDCDEVNLVSFCTTLVRCEIYVLTIAAYGAVNLLLHSSCLENVHKHCSVVLILKHRGVSITHWL